MLSLSKKLDQYLLDLAWSLWTELGVAGVKRKHHKFLITLEELIILTVVLAEFDPRLRDESLDWCSQYHHFFSISRLKTILKDFGGSLNKPFSSYSSTLNALSRTLWPVFVDSPPLKIILSHKSCLRPLDSPALLNIRARSIFGAGARADLVTFFLTHEQKDYAVSDVVEIGYTKRNLAEILEEFSLTKLFDKSSIRNQLRYRLAKNSQLINMLSPIPEHILPWRIVFEILLLLRECIKRTENSADSTKAIEICNLLMTLQQKFQVLNITPPSFQTNFPVYLDSFKEWILELTSKLAQGEF